VSAEKENATWIKRRFFKLCSHYAEARRELSMLFPQIDFLERFAAAANAGFAPSSTNTRTPGSRGARVAARAAGVKSCCTNMPRGDPQRSEHGTVACRVAKAFPRDLKSVRYARAAGLQARALHAGIAPPGADRAPCIHVCFEPEISARSRGRGMQLLIEPLSERTVAGCS